MLALMPAASLSAARFALVVTTLALGSGAGAAEDPEARVTLDAREADVHAIVGALAKAAGFQAVFDPGIACRLTLSVRELPWIRVLKASVDACGLGYEEDGSVVRIATRARLASEAEQRRRLADETSRNRSRRLELFRLSYARAREVAPLLKAFLSEQGQVVWDERSNTLIIID